MIIEAFDIEMIFLIPTVLLVIFWFIDVFVVRNTPGEAGHEDFNLGDASGSLGKDGEKLGATQVFGLMLKNPVIVTIACIEFCSGFLRQAIMQWYRTYAKQTNDVLGLKGDFVYENWGMLLCCAGIMAASSPESSPTESSALDEGLWQPFSTVSCCWEASCLSSPTRLPTSAPSWS